MTVTNVLASIGLLAANGFFVAAEFALLAARRSKVDQLAEAGSLGARAAAASLREVSLMLAGAQLGITMASLGLGIVAEPAVAGGIEQLLGTTALPEEAVHAIGFSIGLSIVVFLHMVVGEMAPKSAAIVDPERAALLLSPPFRAFVQVLRPAIIVLNAAANGVVRLLGVEPRDEVAVSHNARDLVVLVEESGERGLIPTDDLALLTRALEVADLDAEAAMVPRRDVVAVDAATGLEELEHLAARSGRSRIVVYDGSLDRIRGILHVKDLLSVEEANRTAVTAASLARPAMLTPESRKVDDLMLDMRESRQHIAVVVDEYGSVSGLVTLEDLLEEVIGDVEDESDRRRLGIRQRRGGWVVPGSLRPDELAAATDLRLPSGDWETVAGVILQRLGRLPESGEEVRAGDLALRVNRVAEHRIVDVVVRSVGGAEPRPPSP